MSFGMKTASYRISGKAAASRELIQISLSVCAAYTCSHLKKESEQVKLC